MRLALLQPRLASGMHLDGGLLYPVASALSGINITDAFLCAGGSSRVNGGSGNITIVDLSADQSIPSTCSAADSAVRHRTLGRPSGGQIRVELQQPAGWKCSLMLNSNAQGATPRWLSGWHSNPTGCSLCNAKFA